MNYLPTCTSKLVVQHPCQVSFKSMQGCRRSWEDKLWWDGRTDKANTKCPLTILWWGHKNHLRSYITVEGAYLCRHEFVRSWVTLTLVCLNLWWLPSCHDTRKSMQYAVGHFEKKNNWILLWCEGEGHLLANVLMWFLDMQSHFKNFTHFHRGRLWSAWQVLFPW